MKEMRFSELATYNNAPHEPRNYRMLVEVPAPFKVGDVCPCVAYLVPRSLQLRQ
jgi:hypothetical protein